MISPGKGALTRLDASPVAAAGAGGAAGAGATPIAGCAADAAGLASAAGVATGISLPKPSCFRSTRNSLPLTWIKREFGVDLADLGPVFLLVDGQHVFIHVSALLGRDGPAAAPIRSSPAAWPPLAEGVSSGPAGP